MGFLSKLLVKKKEPEKQTGAEARQNEPVPVEFGIELRDGNGNLIPLGTHVHDKSDEMTSLDVEHGCGFSFDDVILHKHRRISKETGEIDWEKIYIEPTGNDRKKLLHDLLDVLNVREQIVEADPEWPSHECFESFIAHQEWEKREGYYTSLELRVAPPTKSGRPRKFPVKGVIDMSIPVEIEHHSTWTNVKTSNNITCNIDYYPDGSIGKGFLRVGVPNEEFGHLFDFVGVAGNIFFTRLKASDNKGWHTYYPSE